MPPVLLIGLAVVAGLLVGIVVIAQVVSRVDRLLTRLALFVFQDWVESAGRYRTIRTRQLQSIHATVTYPVYASKTLFYTVVVGTIGSIVGVYVVYEVIVVLASTAIDARSYLPETLYFVLDLSSPPGLAALVPNGPFMSGLTLLQLFGLLLLSSASFGLVSSGLTYYLRWWYVRSEARRREVLIDESIARTIAFIYALSRSGMVYPAVMRTVAANRQSFGESAEEIGVIVKDVDLFGADLVTALQRITDRTPSDQFADFADNFANVLRSGHNVSSYLHDQYEQYQEQRIENQERLLELFSALGEAYVALLVAGPLFLITVLVIFGLLQGGMLEVLSVLVYVAIPFANGGFILYLGTVSSSMTDYQAAVSSDIERRDLAVRHASPTDPQPARPDGGAIEEHRRRNRSRLTTFRRVRQGYSAIANPIETVVNNPMAIFVVTIPVAVSVIGGRAWIASQQGTLSVLTMDDVFIQAVIFLLGTFALVQGIHSRRIRRIKRAVPDLLNRLESTNEAGMTFTEGLKRVDRAGLGGLNSEVAKLLNDIAWGSRTERALQRFSNRIGSSTIARIVALITNAMRASGHVGPVIRIAADEAREDRRLHRRRRQEMMMYIIIIYLAFFVFLGIAIALRTILIPAIPSATELANAVPTGELAESLPILPSAGAEKSAYTVVLFHAAIVQAICSGFVAGHMGEGRLADGAKHATVMIAVAYTIFLLLG